MSSSCLRRAAVPVKRVWLGLRMRLGRRRSGLGELRREVRTCEYDDVHVMWEMLSGMDGRQRAAELLTFSKRLRAMAPRGKRNATASKGGGGGGAEAIMFVGLANFPGCGEGLEQAARFCNNVGLVVRSLSQQYLLRRDGVVPSPYPVELDYVSRLGPRRSCFHSHLDHGVHLRPRARCDCICISDFFPSFPSSLRSVSLFLYNGFW